MTRWMGDENMLIGSGCGNEPCAVLELMQQADDLSALQTLLPEEYERKLAEMVENLLDALGDIQDPEWILNWVEGNHA